MYPTLRAGDKLYFEPVLHGVVRKGDIILFSPPGVPGDVVHRVVGFRQQTILTRGDNPSAMRDKWQLSGDQILGKVTRADRNHRTYNLLQGNRGTWWHYWLRFRQPFRKQLTRFYRFLAAPVNLSRLLPRPYRPAILCIKIKGEWRWKIVLGKKVIGFKNGSGQPWNITFPYRFFLDQRQLDRID